MTWLLLGAFFVFLPIIPQEIVVNEEIGISQQMEYIATEWYFNWAKEKWRIRYRLGWWRTEEYWDSFDCSSLILRYWYELGVVSMNELKYYNANALGKLLPHKPLKKVKRGDMLYYEWIGNINHVTMAYSDYDGKWLRVYDIINNKWTPRYITTNWFLTDWEKSWRIYWLENLFLYKAEHDRKVFRWVYYCSIYIYFTFIRRGKAS